MEEVKLNQIQVRANTIVTTACRYYNSKEEKDAAFAKKKASTDPKERMISTAEDKNLPFLYQKVINVGPVVHDIKVGDIVKINPLYYLDRKLVEQRSSLEKDVLDVTGTRVKETYSQLDYTFPTTVLNGEECLLLFDRDIEFIVVEGHAHCWDVIPEKA